MSSEKDPSSTSIVINPVSFLDVDDNHLIQLESLQNVFMEPIEVQNANEDPIFTLQSSNDFNGEAEAIFNDIFDTNNFDTSPVFEMDSASLDDSTSESMSVSPEMVEYDEQGNPRCYVCKEPAGKHSYYGKIEPFRKIRFSSDSFLCSF